jgi:inner membrane protein
VDAVTHALVAASLFLATGHPELVPFAIVGSVAIDIDILLMRFPERNPKYYVFTHGGFTHSICGSLLIGCIAFATAAVVTLTGAGAGLFGAGFGIPSFLALLMGSLTHISCDFLAYPGIPLLYPFTEQKYTAGIFAGPSLFLLVVSWTYIGTFLLSLTTLDDHGIWVAIFLSYIGIKAILKLYVAGTTDGVTIPTLNPLKWFVIRDEKESYAIQTRHLLTGLTGPKIYSKFRNVDPEEIEPCWNLPEVRRHSYNSYITTVEKNGDTITFSDPLRSDRYVRYPFNHVTVDVISGREVPAKP